MDFDLAAYIRQSTEASGVPEKLTDRDTALAVAGLVRLAIESRSSQDQRHTPATATGQDSQDGR